ncbi:22660_t:CDS:1, partial [Racocetra persica]
DNVVEEEIKRSINMFSMTHARVLFNPFFKQKNSMTQNPKLATKV